MSNQQTNNNSLADINRRQTDMMRELKDVKIQGLVTRNLIFSAGGLPIQEVPPTVGELLVYVPRKGGPPINVPITTHAQVDALDAVQVHAFCECYVLRVDSDLEVKKNRIRAYDGLLDVTMSPPRYSFRT